MPSLFLTIVFSLATCLYSNAGNAYTIHNKIGLPATFKGEECPKCFEELIADGESKSCPGDVGGCRGSTEVWISDTSDKVSLSYFGLKETGSKVCSVKAPVEVTAHGSVVAYRDRVEVINDVGDLIYNGPWEAVSVNTCIFDNFNPVITSRPTNARR